MIQLGAEVAAEFSQRTIECCSLDMPILAIELEGDVWNLHVVYTADTRNENLKCNFVGPVSIASTTNVVAPIELWGSTRVFLEDYARSVVAWPDNDAGIFSTQECC